MAEREAWRITRLSRQHIRKGFKSGEAALDDYLRRFARQNDEKGLTRTYVATRLGEREVFGYIAIRAGEVACSDLPSEEQRHLPRYPVPVVHLGRLAVDRRAQGTGVGEMLLMHALRKALDLADEVGVRAVEVIAKNEEARSFYSRYGFTPLVDDELHLYLPLAEVRKAFE